jgi:hypothetical protein
LTPKLYLRTLEMTNFDNFAQVYTEELEKAVKNFPEEYAWPVENVPTVAAKMVQAFLAGTYNKDSRAVKATCKRLSIKHTYKEINAYLVVA